MLEKYSYADTDAWEWSLAQLEDVNDIKDMAYEHFRGEIDQFFTPDPRLFCKNVARGVLNQMYNMFSEQVLIARNKETKKLMAYTWLSRNAYTQYALEEMAEARFAHADLSLSPRQRVRLVAQMIQQWHYWCQKCGIPVLVSSSIRENQIAFLHLHEKAGFTMRGSIGYMKVVR